MTRAGVASAALGVDAAINLHYISLRVVNHKAA